MKVISGNAKGRNLLFATVTKPLSQKAKSALFSILESRATLKNANVLDLYAGSGSLGIEALSRGAAHADFVEISKAACGKISKNLFNTSLQDKGSVICMSAERFVNQQDEYKYDIIFIFPPYDLTNMRTVKNCAELLNSEGLLILEHHRKFGSFERAAGLDYQFTRTYGITSLSFYTLKKEV